MSVQRYVRPLRTTTQPEVATARYETAPGAQAQVDWGMLNIWIGAAKVKVHLFVMVLGYSRRIFARAYLNVRGLSYRIVSVRPPKCREAGEPARRP